ncbi:MAG TPA: hypothetical protein VGD60_14795 [Candidatus Acidoferrales bacterium]
MDSPISIILLLLLCRGLSIQNLPEESADQKTLRVVHSAREQARSWIELYVDELRTKALDGDRRAGALAIKIDQERERQDNWETSAWTIPASWFMPGESVKLEIGNGLVAIKGTARTLISRGLPSPPGLAKSDEELVYTITAPPEIRSRILMEGLRRDLAEFSEILTFNGRDPIRDAFAVSWKSAWFDAESVFCRYNPGAKFTDLNGDEEVCQTRRVDPAKK